MQLATARLSQDAKLSTNRVVARPIDLVHLSRYTLGDRALEQEALMLFCSQSVVYLARLRVAETDKAWYEAAHSLKGSARAVGAWRAAEAAAAAEALSGETLEAGRQAAIATLEGCIEEAKAYVISLNLGR